MDFSMKWVYEDDIKRYRKLQLRDKLGARSKVILDAWDHYSKSCKLISVSVSQGQVRPAEWEKDGHYHKISIFGENIDRPLETTSEKTEQENNS